MKATLELPEDLLRAMRLRAVLSGRRLKDVVAETVRSRLAVPEQPTTSTPRRRVKLPIIPCPASVPKFDLTPERMHELDMAAMMESHDASLRR